MVKRSTLPTLENNILHLNKIAFIVGVVGVTLDFREFFFFYDLASKIRFKLQR